MKPSLPFLLLPPLLAAGPGAAFFAPPAPPPAVPSPGGLCGRLASSSCCRLQPVPRCRPVRSGLSSALPASASAPSSRSSAYSKGAAKAAASTVLLVALDVLLKRIFAARSVAFPSSLAGCGGLLAVLLGLDALAPSGLAERVRSAVGPGAALLARWLPVFFVPGLVALPLAPSMGGAAELGRLVAVLMGGFLFTLLTTSWSVMAVQGAAAGSGDEEKENEKGAENGTDGESQVPLPPKKAFSDSTSRGLASAAGAAGVLAAAAGRAGAGIAAPLSSIFLLLTTLSTFVQGARMPKAVTRLVHPLVTCTSLTWLAVRALASLTGQTFGTVLRSYRTGSLRHPPGAGMVAGAGDVLLFMLGPAVVALAVSMYDRRRLVRENLSEVATAVGVSSLGGLLGTALMVRLAGIASPVLRLCLLSRNITSPLAMAIAGLLGADASLAVSMVVVTGLVGANFGAAILDAVGVDDPVARGLGIGAAAHGLGTAAFADEEDAFPFAAIAMALTGALTTVLATVPVVKRAVLTIALG